MQNAILPDGVFVCLPQWHCQKQGAQKREAEASLLLMRA